jgi:ABC-2 type transport system permease protein
MNKLLLVARFEFIRHIKRRGFIFAVLGLPGIFALIIGGALLFFGANDEIPVGVIDQSGLLLNPTNYTSPAENDLTIIPYDNETAARQALDEETIQAIFVVAPDYLDTGQVTVYHQGNPHENIYGTFDRYARASLLVESSPAVAARFTNNLLDVNFVSLSEDANQGDPLAAVLPIIFGFMFVMGIFTTGGYLLQAVVDEKENRTMEILATSMKPENLIIGKIIGLVALGFVQLFIWLAGAIVLIIFLQSRIPELTELSFPTDTALVALLWYLPFYLLIACIWTAIGISVTEVSEGQSALSIISLLTMSPLWLIVLFLQNPDSPLAVVFSLIPFTSPLTILIRRGTGLVPLWQMGLSWLILVVAAVIGMIAVGRLLRIGMLRYGQKVTFRELITRKSSTS